MLSQPSWREAGSGRPVPTAENVNADDQPVPTASAFRRAFSRISDLSRWSTIRPVAQSKTCSKARTPSLRVSISRLSDVTSSVPTLLTRFPASSIRRHVFLLKLARCIVDALGLWRRHAISFHLGDGGRIPCAVECLLFRPVEAHDHVDRTIRRRQPVRLLIRVRRLVFLDIECQGAVLGSLQIA